MSKSGIIGVCLLCLLWAMPTVAQQAQIPVFEILKPNVAIQNMIREDKLHQLESTMQACAAEGMCTMDGSLLKLFKEGRITRDTALLSCVNYETMAKRLGL